MSQLLADVRVELLHSNGTFLRAKTGKTVQVEASQDDDGAPLFHIPIKPLAPFKITKAMQVWAGKLKDGRLTIRLPGQINGQIAQILLSNALPSQLHQLCADLHSVVSNRGPPASSRTGGSSYDDDKENRCVSGKRPLSGPTSTGGGKRALSGVPPFLQKPVGETNRSLVAPPGISAKMQFDDESLTDAQRATLDAVRRGQSVFFTGSAGTGKSYLLGQIVKLLPQSTTMVTATTGLAACHINGTTLNAFAGIGTGEGPLEELLKSVCKGSNPERWRKCKVLIIDEISMLDGALFDKLDAIARKVRGSLQPFGGIQLVLAGDFHQLPPVTRGQTAKKFAFEAESWQSCVRVAIQLTQVMRQKDQPFIRILNTIREGNVTEEDLVELKQMTLKNWDHIADGILPTKLHTHRNLCDSTNAQHLEELESEMVNIRAIDEIGNSGPAALRALAAVCPAQSVLSLKVGAQVMLVKTVDITRGLANGARGVVMRFTATLKLPVVKFASGVETVVERAMWQLGSASRKQVPLELGWALSVHKSQGMTLDRVEVSLANVFETGQAYVALSRARSPAGLRIVGRLSSESIRAHPKVVAFYKSLSASQSE